jgi:hypothetical protein
MAQYGAKREDFGKLCVAPAANALKFDLALFKKPLTLTNTWRPGRSPTPCTSSIASCLAPAPMPFSFSARKKAKALKIPYARLLGTIERHNAFASDPVQIRAGWALDRTISTHRQASGRRTWTSSRPTTTIR